MGIKKTTTKPPPTHRKTKRSRTRHEVTEYQSPLSADDYAALAHELEKNTIETFLSHVEEWARKVLVTAELPDHLKAVRRDAEGRWFDDLPKGQRNKKLADAPKPGEAIVTLLGLVKERPHSPEWLAAQILRFAWGTRHYMKRDRAEDAVWNAILLMQTIALTDFKLEWEWPLDVGIRVIEGGGQRKAKPQEDEHKRWKALFDELRGQNPDKSNAKIHQIVAERCGTSEPAVKKAFQRLEKPVNT
jgi:hypothetical protein